jgi:5-methyltetrahydrofolate--homocysteine methyltransferase
VDWDNYQPPKPKKLGVHEWHDISIKTLREYIDWTPYFLTWQLIGKYPSILKHEVVGEQAQKVFDDANEMLDRLEKTGELKAKAVFGLFPANSIDESIEVYANDDNKEATLVLHQLRQQLKTRNSSPNYCLSDFVASKESGVEDYIGAFAVTAGFGADELADKFLAQHDDYNNIMVKAIADRLAEALAEYLHQQVRKEYWGYAADETLPNDDLIREKYQGIRPAPGYPACPEHTEKSKLWQLLYVENRIGMSLTESYAMWPGASVSGWDFSHPNSKYFAVSKVDKEQAQRYADLKGWDERTTELWLGPNL